MNKKIKKFLINSNKTAEQALKIIDKNGSKTCFIVDDNNEEIDIVRVLDITNLSNKFLIEKILECFVQTRLMYELLQLSKFNHYSRALISRQD